MSKHTPGPWRYQKCQCGMEGCRQYTVNVQGSVGFDEADAALIAAAPDLLEALRSLLSYANTLEMRLLDADGEHRAMQKARAAIKAVEGENHAKNL